MDIHFELRLEERLPDRVFISVVLAPRAEPAPSVDGVSVQIQARDGEPLSPRLLLPISGQIQQPMVSTVELRASQSIPLGARVVGSTWAGRDQREATCPCDPGTALEVHMRGRRVIGVGSLNETLRGLFEEERQTLTTMMPWIAEPLVKPTGRPAVVERQVDHEEQVDEVHVCNAFYFLLKSYRAEQIREVGMHYVQELFDTLHKKNYIHCK